MENSIKKFLEFNGKNVIFSASDGSDWIAIKPICVALNIDFKKELSNVYKDNVLKKIISKHLVINETGSLEEMDCLPEEFIYGWLFMLKADYAELQEYQQKCMQLFSSHFKV
jgi:hypothetical protein